MATQRGGMALLFEGHRYNKVRDGREGTVYWRCARLVGKGLTHTDYTILFGLHISVRLKMARYNYKS